ncbi:MAG: hypothetical protein AB7V46_02500 [Thermomicrobiales bacterium]
MVGGIAEPQVGVISMLAAGESARTVAAARVGWVETHIAAWAVVVGAALVVVRGVAVADLFLRATRSALFLTDIVVDTGSGELVTAGALTVREVIDVCAVAVIGANDRAELGMVAGIAKPIIGVLRGVTAGQTARTAAAAGVRWMEADVATWAVVIRATLVVIGCVTESDIVAGAAGPTFCFADVIKLASVRGEVAAAALAIRKVHDL